jgi:osmotically-inducible protein OsmY
MAKRRDDESNAAGALGAYAVGGAGLLGASVLGGLMDEGGQSRSRDLGPAPIGSDPWLLAEVRAAIAREKDLDAADVVVEVREAIVTLRGEVDDGDASRVERAARTVQGIKKLVVELATR